MSNDLITWLRAQLDEAERWALAANRPYKHAADGAVAPPGGVHWRWVAGDQWETVTPDPALDEFVAEPGYSCHLATVEEWPSRVDGRPMPRTYDGGIVEMDSAAAGHIALHDPARVLREVVAKRRILDLHDRDHECTVYTSHQGVTEVDNCAWVLKGEACSTVRLLALPCDDRPGYRDEWRP